MFFKLYAFVLAVMVSTNVEAVEYKVFPPKTGELKGPVIHGNFFPTPSGRSKATRMPTLGIFITIPLDSFSSKGFRSSRTSAPSFSAKDNHSYWHDERLN
jgi:hypothetical protein